MKKALVTMLSASLVCVAAAITFAACGEEKLYDVTYSGGGTNVTGTAPTEAQHKEGDKFALKANTFTNTGFEFAGWTYGNDTYEAGAQFTMPASNVTFTAKWAEVFTVTYSLGTESHAATGVTAPASKTAANGTSYAFPTLEAENGYYLKGWKVGETETVVAAGAQYTIAGNIALTAVWEQTSVTYAPLGEEAMSGQDGVLPEVQYKNAGDTVHLFENTLKGKDDGYKFAGWKVTDAFGNDVAVDATDKTFVMPASAVTITATWTRLYKVVYLSSEDATEGATGYYEEKTEKLGEHANYAANDSEGFVITEWAVKGESSVKATKDSTIADLEGKFVDYELKLFPVSSHLEVGAKDFSNAYPAFTTAWSNMLVKGEKLTLTGKMTSSATQNWNTVFAYIWSTEIKGVLRLDNYIVDGQETNGTVMAPAENWVITRNIDVNWDNFKTIIADCELTVTFNWISDSKIELVMYAKKGENKIVQTFTIAPAEGHSFANQYHIGLNAEASYAEFTAHSRHMHTYGSDDICTETGCDQVNPVHTAHHYVNGTCTICKEDCTHNSITGNKCSICNATVTTASPNPTNYATTDFAVNVLTGITLNKGQVVVVTGTQTSANTANAHSLVCEVSNEVTIRTDQFGSVFGTAFEGGNWGNGGIGSSSKNVVAGAVTKDGAPASGDYWANVNGLKKNCAWTVTFDYRNTDKLLVTFVLVGANDNTGYEGMTYTVTYSIAFKADATPANSYQITFGGEQASGTYTNITTYAWNS